MRDYLHVYNGVKQVGFSEACDSNSLCVVSLVIN